MAWVNNQFQQYVYDITDLIASPRRGTTNITVSLESAYLYGLNVTSRPDVEWAKGDVVRCVATTSTLSYTILMLVMLVRISVHQAMGSEGAVGLRLGLGTCNRIVMLTFSLMKTPGTCVSAEWHLQTSIPSYSDGRG